MVGIDLANALYRGRTFQRRPDFTRITTDELSLPVLTKKFFTSSWTNGVCVLIADKAEASFRRDTTTIPLITPLELFGEKVKSSFKLSPAALFRDSKTLIHSFRLKRRTTPRKRQTLSTTISMRSIGSPKVCLTRRVHLTILFQRRSHPSRGRRYSIWVARIHTTMIASALSHNRLSLIVVVLYYVLGYKYWQRIHSRNLLQLMNRHNWV